MPGRFFDIQWILLACLSAGLPTGSAVRADAPGQAGPLARHVPAEVRLFLEVRDPQKLLQAPGGSPMAQLLAGLMSATTTAPAGTQPAGGLDWRHVVADAVGLDEPEAIRLLFDGPLAMAADSLGGLGDAILLAIPRDPAALEAVLGARRLEESASAPIRRYTLEADHGLACNGRVVVLGRTGSSAGLYARTLTLWSSDQPVTLADLAMFQDRMSTLPPESAGIFYAGSGKLGGPIAPPPWWPQAWPPMSAVAAGVVTTPRGMVVEGSGVIAGQTGAPQASDLPLDALSRLPTSVLAAWNQTVPYTQAFRRLNEQHFEGPVRFVLDLLQTGLPAGSVEQRLLANLVGDTILVVARAPLPTDDEAKDAGSLMLPAMAMSVETSDPQAVSEVLQLLANNFLQLLNLTTEGEDGYRIESRPLDAGEGTLHVLPLGRLFAGTAACPFLGNLEVSWTVADRWLILATRSEIVCEMVAARRGLAPGLPAVGVHQAMRKAQVGGGAARILLTASPADVAAMIDSWLRYLAEQHPEVMKPEWWRSLRQRQRAEGVQLGILPAPLKDAGIEVDRTLPGWPAHGRLEPGDVILGVDGRLLDRDRLLQSLREGMAMRDRADRIVLRVSRGGEEKEIEIPMSEPDTATDRLQPIELLRQFADILRPFATAGYAAWQPSPDVIHARLELQFTSTAPSE